MKVKDWISYDDANRYDEALCGGLGGWFNHGHRWKDYIDTFQDIAIPYIEAIRTSILENGFRYTGEYHQYGPNGAPLFNDNTVALFSYRAWGDLMAAIWSEAEDKNYCYMDFYM